MLKLFGAGCVLLTGAALGLHKGRTYTQRAQMLREMTELLQALETNLRYRRDETAVLLQGALDACRCKVLPFALPTGGAQALPNILAQALAALRTQTQGVLQAQELRVFEDALRGLGTACAQEELKQLSLAAEQLSQLHTKAAQEAAVQCKLYRALGLSGGAALAVLLL